MKSTIKLGLAACIGIASALAAAGGAFSWPSPDEAMVQKVAAEAALQTARYHAGVAAPRVTVEAMLNSGENHSNVRDLIGFASARPDGSPSVVSRGYDSMVISVPVQAVVKSQAWERSQAARLFVTVTGIRGTERDWVAVSEPFPIGALALAHHGELFGGTHSEAARRATILDVRSP